MGSFRWGGGRAGGRGGLAAAGVVWVLGAAGAAAPPGRCGCGFEELGDVCGGGVDAGEAGMFGVEVVGAELP